MFTELIENWDRLFFLIVLGLEFYAPFIFSEKDNIKRFFNNFGHAILANFLIVLAFTLLGYSLKFLDHSFLSKGIISSLNISIYFKALISFIILDFAIYWQHRLSHKIETLWAFHQVHHQDTSFSTSMALRFHFGEIMYSLIYKIIIISLLGIPLNIFLSFEAVLFACAAFNHANLKLPQKLEDFLDYILVTPKFHRIHHSVIREEQQSNYSFSLPWWDMIFKTYTKKKEVELVGLDKEDVKINKDRGFLKQLNTPFIELKKMKVKS